MTASRLTIALKSIESARTYTLTMLDDLSDEEWFWMPATFPTHIAWHIGHLAYAQYGLVLYRQRGRRLEDASLMSKTFRKQFAKGSEPLTRDETMPLDEIRGTFDRIFDQAVKEIPTFVESELDVPIDPPYAAFPTKYGSLIMCAHHEMLHAGQIGILRRLMGKTPVR